MAERWGRLLAILAAGLLIGVGSAGAQERKLDENFLLLMGARNAARSGKHDTAVTRYRRLLEQDPSQAEVRKELGWVLIAAGRLAEAREEFQTVLRAQPNSTDALKGTLEALKRAGEKEEAFRVLEGLVALEPKNRELRMQLAVEFHNRGRFAEAEKHLAILLGE